MKTAFTEILPAQIKDNPFKLLSSDWMLITAGTPGAFNMMTASWGGLGHLWDKNVCFCFVRPSRHTYGLMERSPHFTLSFFGEEFRDALNFCGSYSGKDMDKAAKTGLVPVNGPENTVYFQQARLVLACRKIYFQDLMPGHFLDPEIREFYGMPDYHRMYVGEVIRVLSR